MSTLRTGSTVHPAREGRGFITTMQGLGRWEPPDPTRNGIRLLYCNQTSHWAVYPVLGPESVPFGGMSLYRSD